jgi:hypothetical protein
MQFAEAGQSISVLYYTDGRPRAFRGTITSVAPFKIITNEKGAEFFNQPSRAMLLVQKENEFAKAEASLRVVERGKEWELTAEDFGWEQVDRRRYLRVPVHIRVNIRTVRDTGDVVEVSNMDCLTEDISMGGAWLRSDQKMEQGVLVECSGSMPLLGEFRAFGVIRWSDNGEKEGFGVEFLDLVGNSHKVLHNIVSQAA